MAAVASASSYGFGIWASASIVLLGIAFLARAVFAPSDPTADSPAE